MTQASTAPGTQADPALESRLRRELEGEVRFDRFTRGLYSTDASHYQIEPIGVVFPRSEADVHAALEIAREMDVPVLPRGGGTSQCGQTVGRALVLDTSRHLTTCSEIGADGAAADQIIVQPGVILDQLNQSLQESGVWFPVDPSTGNRATLGGMAGNNSAGARSLRYGMMVDNVTALEAVLPDGRSLWLGEDGGESLTIPTELERLRALYESHADVITSSRPATMRNVAGYNLDRLDPADENLARLLIGSEGTLAFFTRLRLSLKPRLRTRVLGVCHFNSLVEALEAVQHIVPLDPTAVELVDENVIRLASGHPDFRAATAQFVRGSPKALLLVEFASEQAGVDLGRELDRLEEVMGDQGLPNAVVRAVDAGLQAAVWSVRKAGLNIVMSMAGPRKPISFIEDCAVPLADLGTYARRVNEIFERHDSEGTWYAHASVGCLHVRPALDLRRIGDVRRMRAIAEETHEVVRELGGTHSGEHGDGLLRSEFLESMLGRRMTRLFAEVKQTFDPDGRMNPGKIVDPPRMDDRDLFRFAPGYRERPLPVVLDWSSDGGFLSTLEKCNNNGACRKSDPGVMCPSYRATLDERHSTRGRANALRLAVTGQLGDDGLDSQEMAEAMSLCIGCKGCRRECPTGVDMARIKIEWQNRHNEKHGIAPRERALASLPRIAPIASRFPGLLNRAGATGLFKRIAGLATERSLPAWSGDPWRDEELGSLLARRAAAQGPLGSPEVPDALLFVDTFSRWFEPENARAAAEVLGAGNWAVTVPSPSDRPLCCGRTFLSAGMVEEATIEARRLVRHLAPAAHAGVAIVGLEPSCLLTLRDEVPSLVPGADAEAVASHALMFEEFLDREWDAGRQLPLVATETSGVRVHGHCHQKAFGADGATERMLARVPGLEASSIQSGCCGMAGAFGYHAEHYDVSMQMGELDLFPAVRESGEACIVADGTSCRAQIRDGTGTSAVHAAILLRDALEHRTPPE